MPDAPLSKDPLQAVQALDRDQRVSLLGAVSTRQAGLGAALVQEEPAVYRALLAREDLKEAHCWPLKREIDDIWEALARTAVAEGVPIGRIATEGIYPASVYSPLSYWAETAERLRELVGNADLSEVAAMALEVAEANLRQEREEQRQQELCGLG